MHTFHSRISARVEELQIRYMNVYYIHLLLTVHKPSNVFYKHAWARLLLGVTIRPSICINTYSYRRNLIFILVLWKPCHSTSQLLVKMNLSLSVPLIYNLCMCVWVCLFVCMCVYVCIYRRNTIIAPFILNFSTLVGCEWWSCFALFY